MELECPTENEAATGRKEGRGPMKIAIAGAGGHGRVALDCLRVRSGDNLDLAFFDDRWEEVVELDGVPVRGSISDLLHASEWDQVFVALGDNAARQRVAEDLVRRGRRLVTIVHPHTAISPRATIGEGTIAVAGSVVNAGARVGRCVILNTLSSVGHDCVVEDFAQIASGVNVGGGAVIECGAFLGIGAKVVPLARIGAWSVVGAGSVVLGDLPPRSFCHGTPARVVRPLTPEELPADAE
jgi:sugar O-acyltransferase (sialic acid O-acetyltransferase NeuD family)